jgi:bacillopeptidase F (M6 metalloprotease family)
MWVIVLTVQDCIKVVTVSCECWYWLKYYHSHETHHLNTILNNQWKHSHEAVTTLIQSWTINTSTHKKLTTLIQSPTINKTLTWNCPHLNTILNSQYKHSHETLTTLIQSWTINKVMTVSCECFYWLFRIVLRWWQFHVSVFIDCSRLY